MSARHGYGRRAAEAEYLDQVRDRVRRVAPGHHAVGGTGFLVFLIGFGLLCVGLAGTERPDGG